MEDKQTAWNFTNELTVCNAMSTPPTFAISPIALGCLQTLP